MNTWLIVGGVAAWLVVSLLLKRRGDLSPEAARKLVKDGAELLDVRTAQEFAVAHLPKARNVPMHELRNRINTLGPKSRPIVVYCHSGARSAVAAKTLREAGFTKVANLGAMSRW